MVRHAHYCLSVMLSCVGNPGLHGQPDSPADPQALPAAQQAGVRTAAAGDQHPGA